MAISTVDGLIAGFKPPNFFHKNVTPTLVAGKPQSLWGLGGIPGAGSFDTTLNGVTLTAPQNGQLPFTNPGGGANSYLTRFLAGATVAGGLILLCDRLWHNGGYTITSTSAQNSTTPTWPARDVDGATAGNGVLLGMEVSSATGSGTPTITVSYTNTAGTAGRSATNSFATAASAAAGSFFPIGLQAGDSGVKSVESVTLSATWTSGTMNLVAYRVIASVEFNDVNTPGSIDTLTGGMARIYDGSVPFLVLIPSATTASRVFGVMQVAQG